MSLTPQLVLFEEDHKRILEIAERLVNDANAKAVFLVDKNGQLVAEAGELKGIDTTSLASLVAGNIAASGGLAKLIGEDEFPVHFHQGERDNVHITLVAQRIILVVIFDDRSSLGLVRLRVKKAGKALSGLLDAESNQPERAPLIEDDNQDDPLRHQRDVQIVPRPLMEVVRELLLAEDLGEPAGGGDVARDQRGQRGGVQVLELAGVGDHLAILVHEEHGLGVGVAHESLGHGQDPFLILLVQNELRSQGHPSRHPLSSTTAPRPLRGGPI